MSSLSKIKHSLDVRNRLGYGNEDVGLSDGCCLLSYLTRFWGHISVSCWAGAGRGADTSYRGEGGGGRKKTCLTIFCAQNRLMTMVTLIENSLNRAEVK